MKSFLFKCLKVLVFFYCLAWGIQWIIERGLYRVNDDTFGDWNRIRNDEIKADVIIIGSSRAVVHFNPDSIQKYTGLAAYNLGVNGARQAITQARLQYYLANTSKSPKWVVYSLDAFTVGKRTDLYEKQQFLPYLTDRSLLEPLSQVDPWLGAEAKIPLIKYRGFIAEIFRGIKSNFKPVNNYTRYKGFQFQRFEWDSSFDRQVQNLNGKPFLVDTNKLNFAWSNLKYICDLCKSKNIKLIVVSPPMLNELVAIMPQLSSIHGKIRDITKQAGFIYLDYTENELSKSRNNFYNSTHLKGMAADIFSGDFAKDLDTIIQKGN